MEISERNILIAKLISEGNSLSEIQKILKNDHEIQLTYMDLRMISSDLEVSWEKIDALNVKKQDKILDPNKATDNGDLGDQSASGTVVSVNKVVRPGAVMSGDVKFKSGATAEWQLDQLGRLGLNPTGDSEKPTEEDVQDFQTELQKSLQGKM